MKPDITSLIFHSYSTLSTLSSWGTQTWHYSTHLSVLFYSLSVCHAHSPQNTQDIDNRNILKLNDVWYLTVFTLFLTAGVLHLLLSYIAIFMLTALLILLTACFPCARGLAAQDLLLPLTLILSTLSHARVSQYSQSFIPISGKLWNSLPASVFPPARDLNYFREREVSRHLSHSFGY